MSETPARPHVAWRLAFAFTWSLLVAAYLFFSIAIVPKFQAVYDAVGLRQLPLPTGAVLNISAFGSAYWFLVVMAAGALLAVILSGMLDRVAKRGALSCVIASVLWIAIVSVAVRLPVPRTLEQP